MKLSAFQRMVVEKLRSPDAQLSNHFEGEGAPYRPPDGMYSGVLYPNIHAYNVVHSGIPVPYRTIAALLRIGAIEESHRFTHEAMYGDCPYESTTIYYRVKAEVQP